VSSFVEHLDGIDEAHLGLTAVSAKRHRERSCGLRETEKGVIGERLQGRMTISLEAVRELRRVPMAGAHGKSSGTAATWARD
jgi:hypothetical protein